MIMKYYITGKRRGLGKALSEILTGLKCGVRNG